jgi:AraC-like DNA-binding protein
MEEFVKLFLGFGTFFGLLLSFVQWVKRDRNLSSVFLSLVFLSGAGLCAFAYFNFSAILLKPALFGYYHIPFIYLGGPAIYYYYYSLVNSEFAVRPKDKAAFIPGLAFALLMPVLYFVQPAAFPENPLGYFDGLPLHWLDMLFAGGFIYNMWFAVLLFQRKRLIFEYNPRKKNKSGALFLALLVILGIIVLLAWVSLIVKMVSLLYTASVLLVVVLVLTFVFGNRYPEYFSAMAREIDNQNLQKHILDVQGSNFRKINPIELHIELTKLMLDEKLYERDDLNINVVAEELDIKPYVFSEFLNNYLKINFSQFVKNFRVEAAKEMLREEPDANFLTVAYRVGFNSKTTFNVSFKQVTGMSPREFIKSHKARMAKKQKKSSAS